MPSSDWISLGSLLIAISALFYTYFSNTKKYELHTQYRNEILKWYSCTIEILIRLRTEAKNDNPNKDLTRELLGKLSSQIEIGRFYFPNVDKGDMFGESKPIAYRGYRNVMLDFLVFSYLIFERKDSIKLLNHAEVLQRNFTSHLFETLKPREYLNATKKHTNQAFSKDLRFEDFIEKDPNALQLYL